MKCDVEGCGKEAVAELCGVNEYDDNGLRCRGCLQYDLNLRDAT
jgi:hypothetical protein